LLRRLPRVDPYAAFLARRASRYFLIFDLATSLCFAHTIPKIGAAVFLQPGTGQNWRGGFLRVFLATAETAVAAFGGRPGPRFGVDMPSAALTLARARSMVCEWMRAVSLPAKSEIRSVRGLGIRK
jgi:hypothetical protein